MQCPICKARTECFGTATVLKSHHAEFCHCQSCGFLYANKPGWLDESYSSAIPDPPPRLDEWWYYGLEHSQHVSFYTRRSLQLLGDKFELQLISNGENLHLFSRKIFPETVFKLVTSPLFSSLVARVTSRQSLLPADFARARSRQSENDAHRY